MSEGLRAKLAPLTLIAIAVLYVTFGTVYVTAERANQDEGWYLYAARLVSEGQRPIVDFAYVQPPLLPYVYAALRGYQRMSAGRSVSLLFGLVAVLLTAAAGWRAGSAGGLLAGALMAFTPFVLSQQSIAKPYALANALLALGLCLAVWARGRSGWLAGTAAAFALAALTRNSVAPALPALWLWQAAGPDRRRGLLATVPVGLAVLLAGYLPFLLADAGAVRYHLYQHHARNVAGGGTGGVGLMVVTMISVYQMMVRACPAIAVALVAGVALILIERNRPSETKPEMAFAAVLTALLSLFHFVSMHPYQEYQVVALPAACVLAGLCWGEILGSTGERKMVAVWLVVAAGFVPVLSIGPALAGLPGNRPLPPAQQSDPQGVHGPLRRVATIVAERCGPDEEVFSFQTDVAVESGRRLCPGLTLASFSFTADPEAARWHLVNPAIIREIFATARPEVVVLSPGDLANLLHGRWTADDRIAPQEHLDGQAQETYGPLIEALDEHYELVGRVEGVGQFFETFSILARREAGP